jgi:hypothetical protein
LAVDGEKPVIVGTPGVTVIVLLAGCRIGAVAVTVTLPVDAPVTVKVALVRPSGITTELGIVTLPEPDAVSVTVRPPVPAGAADVTVKVRESPTRRLAVVGAKLKAGGDCTVSVVLAVIGPLEAVAVAVIVVVPTARAVAPPLLLIVATPSFDDDHVTVVVMF